MRENIRRRAVVLAVYGDFDIGKLTMRGFAYFSREQAENEEERDAGLIGTSCRSAFDVKEPLRKLLRR